MSMMDRFGNKIHLDDYVTWPFRSGSYLTMIDVMVTEITESRVTGMVMRGRYSGRTRFTEVFERITKVAIS